MRLNEELLERIEDFFDLIPNDEGEVELDSAMDHLRRTVEENLDGWTNYSEDELAFKALCGLEEIWDLIPESKRDSALEEYYEDLVQELEGETYPDLNYGYLEEKIHEDEYFEDEHLEDEAENEP